MAGFFKVYYDIADWEHWHNPIMVAVWMHLLKRAQWGKKPTRYKGVLQERGQALIGLKEFSADCGISVQQLRTALNTLKSTGEITTTATNKGTVVTIENYAKWQDMTVQSTSTPTSELTTQQQPSNNPVTTQQQLYNKENNNNNNHQDINSDPYKRASDLYKRAASDPYKRAEEQGLDMKMFTGLKNKEWA